MLLDFLHLFASEFLGATPGLVLNLINGGTLAPERACHHHVFTASDEWTISIIIKK